MKTKQTILFVLLFWLFQGAFDLSAQVTIGENSSPDKQAVLDLRSGNASNKGLLMPRVQLKAMNVTTPFADPLTKGMAVYHTGGNEFKEGVFFWNGKNWEPAGDTWFYMPSIPISTANPGNGQEREIDLYLEYTKQFEGSEVAKNPGAPSLTLQIPQKEDFNYYVLGYDKNVFEIMSVSDAGKMTYKVKAAPTDASYINIVFVRK
jgi:hypothetical protein